LTVFSHRSILCLPIRYINLIKGNKMRNLDAEWMEADKELGKKLLKVLEIYKNNREGLPDDLNCPESQTQVEKVGSFSQLLSDVLYECQDLVEEKLMIKPDVQQKLDDRMDYMAAECIGESS